MSTFLIFLKIVHSHKRGCKDDSIQKAAKQDTKSKSITSTSNAIVDPHEFRSEVGYL
jgi:hypothetical protein